MMKLARALGVGGLLVFALLVAVALHSPTRAMRRLVLGRVNAALRGAFRGRIEIASLRREAEDLAQEVEFG